MIEMGFFSLAELPEDIMWWYRLRIVRALNGATGEIWFQDLADRLGGLSRAETYALRDRHAGSRRDFYETYLSTRGPRGEERQL